MTCVVHSILSKNFVLRVQKIKITDILRCKFWTESNHVKIMITYESVSTRPCFRLNPVMRRADKNGTKIYPVQYIYTIRFLGDHFEICNIWAKKIRQFVALQAVICNGDNRKNVQTFQTSK